MEFHPFCKLFPLHKKTVDELVENMEAHGWSDQSMVTMFESMVLDGRHRYLAAERANVQPRFVEFDGDQSAALAFVMRENLLRRHLTPPEKKELFLKLRNDGIWTKRKLGSNQHEGVANGAPSQEEIASLLGVHRNTVIRWESENEDQTVPIRADTSGNDEWYTPAKYIELAREVMGGIDLDPAGCEFAQPVVQATTYYTQEDDGLVQPWNGRVWLNPPYSKGLIDRFVEKICAEYAFGHVEQAIVLTHNFTDTEWFHTLADSASCVCFTRGRIRFYTEDGVGNSPTSGHVFFYFGQSVETFAERFSEIGFTYLNPSEARRMEVANAA